MLVLDFFSWWYGRGWRGVLASNRRRLAGLASMFSVGLLARTLFAPWRRLTNVPGTGASTRLQVLGDNLISRLVGFVVRLVVLLTAGLSTILLTLGTIIEIIVWPVLPVAAVVCIVWGLV